MVTKNKTDWHFVLLMLCLGILGVAMTYVSRHVGEISMRVDQIELQLIKNEPPPLPQLREDQPTMFEALGINRSGE